MDSHREHESSSSHHQGRSSQWPTNGQVRAQGARSLTSLSNIYATISKEDASACVLLATGSVSFKDKNQATFTLFHPSFQGNLQDVSMVTCIDVYMKQKGVLPVYVSFTRECRDPGDSKNYTFRASFTDVGPTAERVFRPIMERINNTNQDA
jgi:hypothetical protein